MKIEKIAIFKNLKAQYDVLHYFRQGLTKSLESQGIEVSLIDLSKLSRQDFFKNIYINPPDLTLAFNGLIPVEGQFICDEIQIPHAAWLVDSAHYFDKMALAKLNIIVSPDLESADLFKKWGASRSYFLPHAFDAKETTSPTQDRVLPIVFCGTFLDPLEVEQIWKEDLPLSLSKDLIESGGRVIFESSLSYQKAFEELFARHSAYLSTLGSEPLIDLIQSFDRYIRGIDRIEMLKSLSGLPVHIYGNSVSNRTWGDVLKDSSYQIHEPVSFPEAIQVMKSAKIVLNSSPMFKTGAHERIFYGLGLGAAVVTNETPWALSHFQKDEELLFYNPNDKKGLFEKIKELLDKPKELELIASRGQKKVLENHTWDVRSKELITILEHELDTI